MAMPLARSLQIRVSGSAKSCCGRSEWLRSDHWDRPHSKGGSLWRYASKQAHGRHADKRDWSFWGCFRRVGTATYRRISLCQDPPACQLHADAGPVAHYSGSNLAFGRMQLCILLSYEPRPSGCFALCQKPPRAAFSASLVLGMDMDGFPSSTRPGTAYGSGTQATWLLRPRSA